ncbi:MAG: hypothetical protein LBQ62_10295, partial [Candidatus Accumulibacter sp.]|nr:hypothetical protein [Accumulibacter sp.]
VIARAEGPRQSIGLHPRDDVSLPFLPERRMAIPDYRASLLGLVKKAKCDGPVSNVFRFFRRARRGLIGVFSGWLFPPAKSFTKGMS